MKGIWAALFGLLCLAHGASPALAQTPDYQSCSSPFLPFGGESGTPQSIADEIVVDQDLVVADLHVLST